MSIKNFCSENIKYYGDQIFAFQLGTFQFSKFPENMAKPSKGNFAMIFKINKICKILRKVA